MVTVAKDKEGKKIKRKVGSLFDFGDGRQALRLDVIPMPRLEKDFPCVWLSFEEINEKRNDNT